MIEIGNKIECYRGEAFEIHRNFVNKDNAPLYIEQGTLNPYLKVSVHSNTYSFVGEYRKNYWLDLSDIRQYKGYKQFTGNVIPKTGLAIDIINNKDSLSEIYNDTISIQTATVTNSPEIGDCVDLDFAVTSGNIMSGTIICVQIPCNNVVGNITAKIYWTNMTGACITASSVLPDSSQFVIPTDYIIAANIPVITNNLYLWFRVQDTSNMLHFWLSDINYIDNFDTNYIGYIITNTGREYYTKADDGNYYKYSFIINKSFLHHDTEDWISGIYRYDMTICSGQLMTDWLTKNFKALYPEQTPPKSNEELAHYICKKLPGLLKDVDITEPLVSYNIFTVLQGPTKLIVKEA